MQAPNQHVLLTSLFILADLQLSENPCGFTTYFDPLLIPQTYKRYCIFNVTLPLWQCQSWGKKYQQRTRPSIRKKVLLLSGATLNLHLWPPVQAGGCAEGTGKINTAFKTQHRSTKPAKTKAKLQHDKPEIWQPDLQASGLNKCKYLYKLVKAEGRWIVQFTC